MGEFLGKCGSWEPVQKSGSQVRFSVEWLQWYDLRTSGGGTILGDGATGRAWGSGLVRL